MDLSFARKDLSAVAGEQAAYTFVFRGVDINDEIDLTGFLVSMKFKWANGEYEATSLSGVIAILPGAEVVIMVPSEQTALWPTGDSIAYQLKLIDTGLRSRTMLIGRVFVTPGI